MGTVADRAQQSVNRPLQLGLYDHWTVDKELAFLCGMLNKHLRKWLLLRVCIFVKGKLILRWLTLSKKFPLPTRSTTRQWSTGTWVAQLLNCGHRVDNLKSWLSTWFTQPGFEPRTTKCSVGINVTRIVGEVNAAINPQCASGQVHRTFVRQAPVFDYFWAECSESCHVNHSRIIPSPICLQTLHQDWVNKELMKRSNYIYIIALSSQKIPYFKRYNIVGCLIPVVQRLELLHYGLEEGFQRLASWNIFGHKDGANVSTDETPINPQFMLCGHFFSLTAETHFIREWLHISNRLYYYRPYYIN